MIPLSIENREKDNIKEQFEIENPSFHRKMNLSDINTKIVLENIYSKISKIINSLFFLWIVPILKNAHNSTSAIKPYKLPNLSRELKSEKFIEEIKPIWKETSKNHKNYLLITTIVKSNLKEILKIIILHFINLIFSIANVYLFKQILLCFKEKNKIKPQFNLKITIVLLLSAKLITIFLDRSTDFLEQFQGAKIKNQIKALIYHKLLKITRFSNFSEGEIINFIQNDSEKFITFLQSLPSLVMNPLKIAVYIIMLFHYFGYIFIIGVILLFFLLYMSMALQKKLLFTHEERQKFKDDKMKEISNVISMIKSIKLYAWEEFFHRKIDSKCNDEINILKKCNIIQVYIYLIYDSSSLLIFVISIILYFFAYGKMDLSNIYTTMYIFQSLNEPLYHVPYLLSGLLNTLLSMKRIELFLAVKQHNTNQIQKLNAVHEDAIVIENCSFGFIDEKVKLLNNINLRVKKGKFIGVFGEVGSGKSNLFNAILNNYDILDNKSIENENDLKKIKINGKISYVSQVSWILNETLMNNILFFSEMNEEKYQKVIDLCQLKPDIAILKGGDMAEIGAKGLNLSGGQKSRISIARAIYNNSDIFLFDDPLASVDAFVGRKLFEGVFKSYLSNKTRLLITHSLQFIEEFDEIIYMKNGSIEFHDTLQKFKNTSFFQELSLVANKRIDPIILNNSINHNNYNLSEGGFKNKTSNKKSKDKNSINDDNNEKNKLENNNNESTIITNNNNNENTALIIDIDSEKKKDKKKDKDKSKITKLTKKEKIKHGKIETKQKLLYFKQLKGLYYIAPMVLLNIFWKGFQLGSDYLLNFWSEKQSLTDRENLKYLAIYAFLSILIIICMIYNMSVSNNWNIAIYNYLQNSIINKLINAPVNLFFDIIPQGRILSILSSDVNRAPKMSFAIESGVKTLFQLLSCLLVCYMYNWQSLLIVPLLILLEFKVHNFYLIGGNDLIILENHLKSPIVSVFNETIPGTSIIRAFHYQKKFKDKLYIKLDEHFKVTVYEAGSYNWYILFLNLISFAILFTVVIFSAVCNNRLTQATIGMLLNYTMKLSNNLFKFFSMISRMEKVSTSIERCMNYMDIPQEKSIFIDSNTDDKNSKYSKENRINKLSISNKFIKEGKIDFIDYSCKYRPETPIVLDKLNITINKNEKIGVVGRTGSGKSSLCLALFRIIESFQGKILIDGMDISKIDLNILRNNITIIPQEPYLFEGTLRENLDPHYDYTDAFIKSTLITCGLIKFIENLYIKVNNNGDNFSSGEKQLLCFVRALLRKNKVIVMDEATSNIDYNTELTVQGLIEKYLKESTVITVAHRIKTVINYDKILVLDKGNVAEFDSPMNLLKNPDGIFYNLYSKSTIN